MFLQPQRGAQALDGGGEGFIERRIPLGIQHLVGQLVQQQAHQIALAAVYEGGQQRVAPQPVQVAQGGIGGHAVHRHL